MTDSHETQEIMKLVDDLLASKISTSEFETAHAYKIVMEFMESAKSPQTSLPSQLWNQYITTIEIFLQSVEAECTGSWKQHLQACRNMLPYLASAGHYLYLKSGHLYLQSMLELENTNPKVYQKFMEGYHVIRRTDRY